MDGLVVGNIMGPCLIYCLGWQVALWVLAGIAVELVMVQLIFRVKWPRAIRLGLLMNLASTLAGLAMIYPGIILLVGMYCGVFLWILQVGLAAWLSAYIHRVVTDFFMEPIHDPFSFRWLLAINLVGIGIGSACVWAIPVNMCG